MQFIPAGIIETLAPYLHLAWLVPAAIIGYLLGWRMRNSDALTAEQDHHEALQSRELRLRTFQSHIESRDRELIEQKHQYDHERDVLVADLEQQKSVHDELKSTIGKTNTQLAESNSLNTRQLRQFGEERAALEQKIALFEQQLRSSEGYAEKFNALKAKYKQMDARRSREIVELQADIVDLKREQITVQEDRDKHLRFVADMQTSLEQMGNEHTHQQTLLQSTKEELTEKEKSLRSLDQKLAQQASTFENEKHALLKHQDRADQLQTRIEEQNKEHSAQTEQLGNARRQIDSLLERIQELSDTNQAQLQEYDTKHAEVNRRLGIVQDESAREIKTLHERLNDMAALKTVNKNQSRSIERLETQLKDLRKRNTELSDQEVKADEVRNSVNNPPRIATAKTGTNRGRAGKLNKLRGQLEDRDQQLEERQQLIGRLHQSLATETSAREKTAQEKNQDWPQRKPPPINCRKRWNPPSKNSLSSKKP